MTEGKAAPTFHRHCEPEAKQSRGRPLRPAVRRPLGCFVAALLAKTGEGRRSSQRRERGAVLLAKAEEKRSEEHTSELQSLMRISYAVFFLKKKKQQTHSTHKDNT